MLTKIKNWINDHPYFLTSAVFLVILYVGWRMLYWGEETFAFILLLYFIVTLGIRLDDISRQLGIGQTDATSLADKHDRIIRLMQQIQRNLSETNDRLGKIQAAMDRQSEP